MSDLFAGLFSAAGEVLMFAAMVAGLAGAGCVICFIAYVLFQVVKTCTRNLVRNGEFR